jgi:molecular chaperone DnaK
VPQIEVTFDIDANGIVNVSAKDKATNKAQHITITASSGLSEAEIQKMVKDAQEHEAEDKKRREAIEARNKLEALTFQVQKHLDENRDKIAEADRTELEGALKDAKDTVDNNRDPKDAAMFEGAFERLQKASHKMAEALYRSASGAAAGTENAAGGRRGNASSGRRCRWQGRRHRRRVHRGSEEHLTVPGAVEKVSTVPRSRRSGTCGSRVTARSIVAE